MVDTVGILLDRQFNQVQRQDAQLFLDPSVPDAFAAIQSTDGIASVEEVDQAAVVVSAGERRYATELVGFVAATRMHEFASPDLPGAGVVAGRSLRSLLGVEIGDTVTLTSTANGVSIPLPIVGFVDEPLGTFVCAGLETAAGLRSSDETTSAMVIFADGADREVMRQRLTALPGVVAYVDSRAVYQTAQSLFSLFYAFVRVMLAFGGVMAFALIFNTATVNASERSSELTALKVNGASPGQLARLLGGENLPLTVLSIMPGLAIGYQVSAAFMGSFSSDLFQFDLHMRTRTLVLTAVAVLAVSAFAQWPASRAVTRLDVARVVRERSQ